MIEIKYIEEEKQIRAGDFIQTRKMAVKNLINIIERKNRFYSLDRI